MAMFIEPQAGVTPIIQVIAQAQHSIDLNAYELTDHSVLAALQAARQRGVQVRILLETTPYGARPSWVAHEVAAAQATGATVHAPPPAFRGAWVYDHAKYLCTGRLCAIGTANFTEAAFHRNREAIEVTAQPSVVAAARAVFAADWTGTSVPVGAARWLILSPGAGPVIGTLLDQAGGVCVETEEMGNDRGILRVLERQGAAAHVVLPDRIARAQIGNVERLVAAGVQVRQMPPPRYIHAKIIAGARWVYLGSQNFTSTSLDRNREMGITVIGADAAALRAQCVADWQRATPFGNGQTAGTAGRASSWVRRGGAMLARHTLLRVLLHGG